MRSPQQSGIEFVKAVNHDMTTEARASSLIKTSKPLQKTPQNLALKMWRQVPSALPRDSQLQRVVHEAMDMPCSISAGMRPSRALS